MKNTFGNNLSVTIFGESHGSSIGVVIDGLSPGITVDDSVIKEMLSKRRPSGAISTSRAECDEYIIQSGVFNGKTTGTPLCITIPNRDTNSRDYAETRWIARPSHADYTANCKYHGFEDYRGGGHFSGRVTAGLVAAGAVVMPALENLGIRIGTHIKSCAGISDRDFHDLQKDMDLLSTLDFAVLDGTVADEMKSRILEAKSNGDSVGGVLETVVTGLEAGLGEPWFDSIESLISHAVFSVPAVKGIEFGAGFSLAEMYGTEANDCFCIDNGTVQTVSNNSGGINGGISNGMPIIFKTAFRPTPTVSAPQNSVNFKEMQDTVLSMKGRHDPCIVHRARIVIDAVTALVVGDLLAGRYGDDWAFKGGR